MLHYIEHLGACYDILYCIRCLSWDLHYGLAFNKILVYILSLLALSKNLKQVIIIFKENIKEKKDCLPRFFER